MNSTLDSVGLRENARATQDWVCMGAVDLTTGILVKKVYRGNEVYICSLIFTLRVIPNVHFY